MIYNYDELVENFNQALLVKLRKHGVEEAFLDFWVPDENPLIGILGMIDSAQIAQLREIQVKVKESTLDSNNWDRLKGKLSNDYEGEIKVLDGYRVLQVNFSPNKSNIPQSGDPRKLESRKVLDEEIIEKYKRKSALKPQQFIAGFNFGNKLTYEFKDKKIQNSNLLLLKVKDNLLEFCFAVDIDGNVVDASYNSSPELQSNPIEMCCQMAIGLPIQEVADHLVLKIMNYYIEELNPDLLIRAIALPNNTAKEFVELQNVLRVAYDCYLKTRDLQSKTNFYYDQVPDFWNALEGIKKTELINKFILKFISANCLNIDAIKLVKIETNKYKQDIRFAISLENSIKSDDKPKVMRNLEGFLRKNIFKQVELIAERVQDISPLRRLTKDDLRKEMS
jgi:hypothetical protein